jgi:hypothetical protein
MTSLESQRIAMHATVYHQLQAAADGQQYLPSQCHA